MKDKLVGIAESAFGFSPVVVSENYKEMELIDPLTESERNLMAFTVDKVKIDSTGVDNFIEYSNNLERYLQDSGKEFHEGVEEICKAKNLLSESIVIVVDESCADKLDMAALKEHYNVRRK